MYIEKRAGSDIIAITLPHSDTRHRNCRNAISVAPEFSAQNKNLVVFAILLVGIVVVVLRDLTAVLVDGASPTPEEPTLPKVG